MMSASDGVSNFWGMPSSAATCFCALTRMEIVAFGILNCCFDQLHNVFWLSSLKLQYMTVQEELHVLDVIPVVRLIIIVTFHQFYE